MNHQLRHLLWWRIGGWSLVAFTCYVCLDPTPPDLSAIEFGDKIVHTTAYVGMMLWFCQCYPRRSHILLAAFLICLGVGLEFLQGWSGYRTFDTADMAANSLGVFIGWVASFTPLGQLFKKFESISPR